MAGPKRYVRFLKDRMNPVTVESYQSLHFLPPPPTKKKEGYEGCKEISEGLNSR